MILETNREVEIFAEAYRIGFRAGQLDWRKQMIAGGQFIQASSAGERIAVFRDNISTEEYARIVEAGQPEYLRGKP